MALITSFDPWKSQLCSCPAKLSLSAYTGCSHACLYCYASSYIRQFSRVREKVNFLNRLKSELRKLPTHSTLAIANSSDPYADLEKKFMLTRDSLKLLQPYRFNIHIVTKSPLVTRDLDLLKGLSSVVVAMSITTLDTRIQSKLEAGAGIPVMRLRAIEILSKSIPVVARIDPLIYPLTTDNLAAIVKELKLRGVRQIITSTYKAKPDNFKKMCSGFPEYKRLWEKLYLQEGEKKGGYLYLPLDIRKKLIEEMRNLVMKEGLEFSSCREGFQELNTAMCDGANFLELNKTSDFRP